MSTLVGTKPVTAPWVKAQKGKNKISMLTAYDYPTAVLLDEAGVDLLLVGDSLGTVLYGEPNTLSVTLEDMLRHTKAVAKGAKRAMVVADMPFLTYQVSIPQAVENAGRLLKEAQAQAVKLEGGVEIEETIRAICKAGIPVVAHIGLTPQSIHAMGTYRMHGKTNEERRYLLESAAAVTRAGAFSVVLECIENSLANEISKTISIPTIGIGSGENCDGQVLVIHDLIGLTVGKVPSFVKSVDDLSSRVRSAAVAFVERTKNSQAEAKEAYAPSH